LDLTAERAALKEALNIEVSLESYVLGLICTIDMISTILLVRSGKAIEANPVLMPFMAHGIGCFFVAKTMLFVVPLFSLELFRNKRPLFVRKMLRVCIAAYLVSYCIGVMHVNQARHAPPTQIASRADAP
jgi:hypothetical protein